MADTVSVCARKTLENVGVHAQLEGMADLGVGAKNFGLLQVCMIRPTRSVLSIADRLNRLTIRKRATGPERLSGVATVLCDFLHHRG